MDPAMMIAPPTRLKSARSSASALRARRQQAGFTLLELMTVVVIVGILATLATYGVRKYTLQAKKSEAISMLTQIRAAEEAYRDETFQYLGLDDFDVWHPTSTPDTGKRGWASGTTAQGTPPKYSKARMWLSMKSWDFWLLVASAYVNDEAPSTATKSSTSTTSPVSASTRCGFFPE